MVIRFPAVHSRDVDFRDCWTEMTPGAPLVADVGHSRDIVWLHFDYVSLQEGGPVLQSYLYCSEL